MSIGTTANPPPPSVPGKGVGFPSNKVNSIFIQLSNLGVKDLESRKTSKLPKQNKCLEKNKKENTFRLGERGAEFII